MHNFTIGSAQQLEAADEIALLTGIEAALDFCLDAGNVFAIFDWKNDFCQIYLDAYHDMHLETTYGELAKHAGFHESVEQWPSHSGNFLPASWHARAKMVAGAMTRAFIDAGNMSFPATISVQILPTGNAVTGDPQTIQTPATPGAQTIGFVFGEDKPMGWFVERLGAALGLYAATASIEDVKNRIQTRWANTAQHSRRGPHTDLSWGSTGHEITQHSVKLVCYPHSLL